MGHQIPQTRIAVFKKRMEGLGSYTRCLENPSDGFWCGRRVSMYHSLGAYTNLPAPHHIYRRIRLLPPTRYRAIRLLVRELAEWQWRQNTENRIGGRLLFWSAPSKGLGDRLLFWSARWKPKQVCLRVGANGSHSAKGPIGPRAIHGWRWDGLKGRMGLS